MDWTRDEVRERLQDALDERLTPEELLLLQRGLASHPDLAREFEGLRELRGTLLAIGTENAPADLLDGVRAGMTGGPAGQQGGGGGHGGHLRALGPWRTVALVAAGILCAVILVQERPWDPEGPGIGFLQEKRSLSEGLDDADRKLGEKDADEALRRTAEARKSKARFKRSEPAVKSLSAPELAKAESQEEEKERQEKASGPLRVGARNKGVKSADRDGRPSPAEQPSPAAPARREDARLAKGRREILLTEPVAEQRSYRRNLARLGRRVAWAGEKAAKDKLFSKAYAALNAAENATRRPRRVEAVFALVVADAGESRDELLGSRGLGRLARDLDRYSATPPESKPSAGGRLRGRGAVGNDDKTARQPPAGAAEPTREAARAPSAPLGARKRPRAQDGKSALKKGRIDSVSLAATVAEPVHVLVGPGAAALVRARLARETWPRIEVLGRSPDEKGVASPAGYEVVRLHASPARANALVADLEALSGCRLWVVHPERAAATAEARISPDTSTLAFDADYQAITLMVLDR